MESLIAARIRVEANQRSGADPTRQKIIAQLDKMNSYDVGGFKVSFSPDNHVFEVCRSDSDRPRRQAAELGKR